MSKFVKCTLASMLGMLLFTVVVSVVGILALAGKMANESMSAPVRKSSILHITLAGSITEVKNDNPLDALLGEEVASMGLDQLLTAIRKARDNGNIKGIYIDGGIPLASQATLLEIRQALQDFKKSGKFIYTYADQYTQGGYYVCSVADLVMVNPSGAIDWHGLASTPLYYKDMLEKLGVKMQIFKVGTYKSAVEPFLRSDMSEANREQLTALLDDIWGQTLRDVSKSRKIKTETLDNLADSFMALQPAKSLLKYKMVDRLAYLDEVKTELKKKMGLEEDEELNFVSVTDMAKAEEPDAAVSDNEVAVYYAFGTITTEVGAGLNAYEDMIVSSRVVKDLQKLRKDGEIKAVVLRVNSGGGSAYASEQIWREVELLRETKPVVVSMGDMAASGGYYISCGANKIFAESTTLTGSIGIFGMVPDLSDLVTNKIGVKMDAVKTNNLSDFGNVSRPLNEEECRLMQSEIERGYELFTGRVAVGRKMSVERVKEIAEGRVWSGRQAQELGLVDSLGNLDDAVECAAKLAELEDYVTAAYPKPQPWYASLLDQKRKGYMEEELRALLGDYYTTFSILSTLRGQDRVQARLPFDLNIH